ncbi:MAG: 50S ribosomal protein L9 [Patescibacteria group bacterium]|jgi:large subunit ribosomal protein L9
MKVIFTKALQSHKSGDIAEVAEGYARNFLFPRNVAQPATADHLAAHAARVQREQHTKVQAAQQAEAVLGLLHGKTFSIPAKANAQGTLYAALTPKQIATALATQCGMPIPKSVLRHIPTLKTAGSHTVHCPDTHPAISFILSV